MGFDRVLSEGDVMRRRASFLQRIHIDGWLVFLLLVLGTIGLFVLYSAGSMDQTLLIKQATSFGVGLLLMVLIAQLEPRFMASWAALLYALGIVLLLIVELVGHKAMGATRWISIPGVVRFQPAELMKVFVPMTLAWYLARHNLPPSFKRIVVSMLLMVAPVILIARQPDLGTAMLVMISGMFVLFLAGLRWRWILGAVAAVVPIAVGMWMFIMHPYQKQRVLTFLNPESDPLGSGWNIIQSKAAIGSGGVFGKGWMLGTQSHLDFLPESHTDFIIAVLGEEFGLVGIC